jgi:hypothetical protein
MMFDKDDDDDFASQNVISLATASQDVYTSETAYKFGAVRFNVRGFDNEYNQTYINGINFNDQIRGRFNHSMLGGLNDVTRNRDVAINTTPSSFGFGDLGGVTNINTKAASYGKGGRITASATNRNYKLRGIGTYSTGLMNNGFAVTASIGYRWANEGYIEGTFYNAFAYLLSVEKVFENKKHSISLTTMGSPLQRGQSSATFQEVYDLVGSNHYNSSWGYQNGVKRNANVVTSNDPMVVLSHKWQISSKTQLMTGIGARYNMYGRTALNWYESAEPRPDYYKYLPSYFDTNTEDEEGSIFYNNDIKDIYTEKWQNDKSVRQILWDDLYMVNYLARNEGQSARYILEERHSDLLELAFNSVLKYSISDFQNLEIGVEAKKSKGMYYKTINDLLGAGYWLDVDAFAERDFRDREEMKQNDMEHPNREVKEGDKFGYNYDLNVNHANIWIQNRFFYPKLDLYYAAKISCTEFQRDGHMKNGRAPNNSLGKGKAHLFVDQAIKGGFTYKITGRHFINANILYETKAPLPNDAYLSSRTKDDAAPQLNSERVASADVGYLVSMPLVRGRISVFQANFYDRNETYNFYHDDYRSYINYVLTGVQKVHRGVELGMIISVTSRLKLNLAGTIAEYYYNNRPTGYATFENGSQPSTSETVYLINFYEGGTPQTACTFGFSYAFPGYWFFDANYNYFDRIYVDLKPNLRTEAATRITADTQQELEDRIKKMTEQEKFDRGGTLDLSLGKSIRFQNGYFLSLNLSVSNVLNNTNLRTGGFESGRLDYETFKTKIPSKYYYAQGFNYFFNALLRF